MNIFRRAQKGKPLAIPAAFYNLLVDNARGRRRGPPRPPGAPARSPDEGVVFVQNDTGAARDRMDVVGLSSPVTTPAQNLNLFLSDVVLSGVTPTAAYRGKFAVLMEPVAAGAVGRAVAVGVTPVRLHVHEDAHTHADIFLSDDDPPEPSCAKLASSLTGAAQILWVDSSPAEPEDEEEADPDVFWAIVRLANPSSDGGRLIEAELQSYDAGSGTYAYKAYVYGPDGTRTLLVDSEAGDGITGAHEINGRVDAPTLADGADADHVVWLLDTGAKNADGSTWYTFKADTVLVTQPGEEDGPLGSFARIGFGATADNVMQIVEGDPEKGAQLQFRAGSEYRVLQLGTGGNVAIWAPPRLAE